MGVLHIISTFSFILLIIGILYRKTPKIHIPLMVVAFLIDMALVLYIELNRSVMKQIIHESPFSSLILNVHILFSVILLILFCLQIFIGIKTVYRREKYRYWHKYIGWSLLGFRVGNYVTSFLIV